MVLLDARVRCAKFAGGDGGGRNISNGCDGTVIECAGTNGGDGGGSVLGDAGDDDRSVCVPAW